MEPMMCHCKLNIWEQMLVKFESNHKIVDMRIWISNVICKLVTILLRRRSVKLGRTPFFRLSELSFCEDDGYITYSNTHLLGAYKDDEAATVEACKARCCQIGGCWAVDWK